MTEDNEFVDEPEELDPSLADPEIEGTEGVGEVSQPALVSPQEPEASTPIQVVPEVPGDQA